MKFKVDFITILTTFFLLGIFLIPIPIVLYLFAFSSILAIGGISNHTLGSFIYGILISLLSLSYMYLIMHFIRCLIAIFNKNCKSITVNNDNIILDHKRLGNIELNLDNIENINTKRRLIAQRGVKSLEISFYEIIIETKDNQKYTIAISDYDDFSSEIETLKFNCLSKQFKKYSNL